MSGFYNPDDVGIPREISQDAAQKFTVASDYEIIGITGKDSLGDSEAWKSYVDREKLSQVWGVGNSSPWKSYEDRSVFELLDNFLGKMAMRYSSAETRSELYVKNKSKQLLPGEKNRHALILDLGGPHSIALAAKFARIGYQPVVLMPADGFQSRGNTGLQELATFLYYAREIEQAREDLDFTEDSPPAFILDIHREGALLGNSGIALPSKAELLDQNIRNVLYMSERDMNGEIEHPLPFKNIPDIANDLKPYFKEYQRFGVDKWITVHVSGFDPWPHLR